ncbi:hypothetical protein [Vibrio sp. Hal054]|uniref:hypothetical protein n=1 Tax=Vibrio sp. Hal054 TaxID=3035158 RepID=UPI00301D3ABE
MKINSFIGGCVLLTATSCLAMEESWTLQMSDKCDTVTLSLPLPALDMGCNTDTSSGNPSSWFNPFETCELNFDMIGLPSIADIKAGLAGAVCDKIQEVKASTIDGLIDEVNQSIDSVEDGVNDDIDEFTSDISN